MGTTVLELIEGPKPRKQASGAELLSLASGGSRSSTRRRATRSVSSRAKTKTSKSRRAKAPCKYGPRDADGRCPKKPAASLGEKVLARSTGIRVRARSRKSIAQRAQERIESQIASEVAGTVGLTAVKRAVRKHVPKAKKAVVDRIAREAEIASGAAASKSVAQNIARIAKGPLVTKAGKAAAPLAAVAGTGALIAGAGIAAGAGLKHLTRKAAGSRALAAVQAVEKNLARTGQKLTRKQRATLLQQHIAFFKRNP